MQQLYFSIRLYLMRKRTFFTGNGKANIKVSPQKQDSTKYINPSLTTEIYSQIPYMAPNIRCIRGKIRSSVPSQLLKRPRVIPNLGHMPNLSLLKLHHIAVIRIRALPSRIQPSRILRARMCPLEDGTGADSIPLLVLAETEQLVTRIRHHLVDSHHELRVILQRTHTLQSLILAGGSTILVAVMAADRPSLTLLAGLEKESGCCKVILHSSQRYVANSMERGIDISRMIYDGWQNGG